jgi:ribosomal protein S18 acetylase RimI-like enzyme
MPQLAYALGADLSQAELVALYASVGWTAYTKDAAKLEAALAGSSTVVTAREDGALVGLVRVVSDGASVCYLQDILVHPDHQRSGIGRQLVTMALEPYGHVRQKVLLTDDDAAQKAFYESLGFQQVADPLRAFVRFD